MSKAFTSEETEEAPVVAAPRAPLPPGEKNYVTARGLALLRAELAALQAVRGPADPNRTRRIAQTEERIATAVVTDPASQPRDEVRFGATVTVRSAAGVDRQLQLVGVDEADIAHGKIAFVAPLARALLGKRVGESATVRTPKGEDELEVLAIRYEDR